MISTPAGFGVADAAMLRAAWTFEAPAAHLPAANAARAGVANAQHKRRPAAATAASVIRGSS